MCLRFSSFKGEMFSNRWLMPNVYSFMLHTSAGLCFMPLEIQSIYLCMFKSPFGKYCFLKLPLRLCSVRKVFYQKNKNKILKTTLLMAYSLLRSTKTFWSGKKQKSMTRDSKQFMNEINNNNRKKQSNRNKNLNCVKLK